MELEVQKKFKCPSCFERISMLLDLSEDGTQQYVEDCEVCCHAIQLEFTVAGHRLVDFSAAAAF